MKISKVGTKLKYSPYRNRALKASFPVACFIKVSAQVDRV
jgi:hypothetical protein